MTPANVRRNWALIVQYSMKLNLPPRLSNLTYFRFCLGYDVEIPLAKMSKKTLLVCLYENVLRHAVGYTQKLNPHSSAHRSSTVLVLVR